jgi:hypothetical protein
VRTPPRGSTLTVRFYEGLGFAATHEGMKLDLAVIAEPRPPAASDDIVQ